MPRSLFARSFLLVTGLALVACTQARTSAPLGDSPAAWHAEQRREPSRGAADPLLDFRPAARVSDWATVASRIDTLPEPQQSEPGLRYVRALAAQRLGDCETTLVRLRGLDGLLPLLADEIDALAAECHLAIGPFEQAALYYAAQSSPETGYYAALAWSRAGHPQRALDLLDALIEGTVPRGSRRSRAVNARALRAQLRAELGKHRLARKDYHWLATVAVRPGAAETYERLARERLSKSERLARAEHFARRGEVEATERELERLKGAPGSAPPRSVLRRTLAQAHFRSRQDDVRAARLYEQAARLSGSAHASDLFNAARAWSRAGNVERAVTLYREIGRRFAGTAAEERAHYARARAHYATGGWAEAESAYTEYLRRYARGRNQRRARFVVASRYERAISQLAAGRHSEAASGFQDLLDLAPKAYPQPLLRHLRALALAQSGEGANENRSVEQFEQIVASFPLSFSALASAARLKQLGRALSPTNAPPAGLEYAEVPELSPKVRLLLELGLNGAAEQALHREEPALRRRSYPRAAETLCAQYGRVDVGFRGYRFAQRSLGQSALRRAPTASNLWQWQCLHPRPYDGAVTRLEARYSLPSGLVHSVMRQESGFRRDARSPAGAVGLMQLMPKTAERAARELALAHTPEQLTQVHHNLELGAYYLGKLLAMFDGRVVLGVAGYNAGPHAVGRWLQGADGLELDTWVARIPYGETRNYVMRVMSNWARYRYLGAREQPSLALHLPEDLRVASTAY